MSSNINPYNIDGTFPVAGQDNSSQGFRDNFTNIKNNFLFAQGEIDDLQSKAILASALNGQTVNNDMAGTIIRRPQLAAWTQTLIDLGVVSSSATLDFNLANFQKITTAGSISMNFINWPTSTGIGSLGYGAMRVWLHVSSASHTVTLPASVSIGVVDISGYNPATSTLSFDFPGDYLFEFSSIDGGNNYVIVDLRRNRATFRDQSFYLNNIDAQLPTLLIGYGAGLTTALGFEVGEDTVSINGSVNSVGVGTLSQANIAYTQMDTGGIAGYSVSAGRGNLQLGTVNGVHSGDLIGYFNGIAFTGAGGVGDGLTTGVVPQQLASIDFFATGSNVAYGLGGNIAFFTGQDGTPLNTVNQAMGIENDQSVKFYGNAITAGNAAVIGNLNVSGSITTNSRIIEGATFLTSFVTNGTNNVFTANNAVSTVIIDSTGSNTINMGNVILPTNPTDRQTIKIVSVAPITAANIYAVSPKLVKYVPANKFSSGNVAVKLTYMSDVSTWYLS